MKCGFSSISETCTAPNRGSFMVFQIDETENMVQCNRRTNNDLQVNLSTSKKMWAMTRTEVHGYCQSSLREQTDPPCTLPGAIRSDNGSPVASSSALLGVSRLSAWGLACGVDEEWYRPGCA